MTNTDIDIPIPPAAPPPWPDGFYRIERSIMDCCATEGCGQVPSMRLEIEGTGSVYCEPCARKIAAIQARPVDAALTIPPEALEAAAKAICFERYDGISAEAQMLWRAQARAACLAMIKAWPGMKHELDWDAWLGERHTPNRIAIILPLPQKEPRDAE